MHHFLALATTLLLGQADAKPLTFCAVPTSAPRTARSADGVPEGIDVTIAKSLCRHLGRRFEVHWCGSAACSRNCLREGRCDVVLGQPHDPSAWPEAGWSVPYAGSQFGLIVPQGTNAIQSLVDLHRKRLGIVAGSVALSTKDHVVLSFKTREEVLDKFAEAALDAAFIDADFAEWHLHKNPQLKMQPVSGFVPREHWNLAMAVRAKDATLLVDINRVLSQMAESGEIRKIYAEHGVTFRPPFTATGARTAKFDAWKQIRERGELVVSMDPANLPYSSAKGELPGFDVELARALAQELGVKLRLEWIDIQRETSLGRLLEYDCDLAMGAPIDPNAVDDEEELAGKVIYSRPYYGTGYVLVNRKDGPRVKALAELKGKSNRLGTEAGSIADYELRQRGFLRRLYRNQLAVLNALNEGDIDYAYLWSNTGWTLHHSPDFKLEVTPGYVPEDHWNIAIAMRHGDDELKRHIDTAIAKLVQEGAVSRALARYHVPYFSPFAETKQSSTDVIRHAVAQRGLEPQMGKRQSSKNPYSGLERIRSAGTLVVGLDQHNLPFSTVHPKPAGLDYEIAALLAKELGVSLQIYWAYSSHDSYPSKLATKGLCDVILGITPDDRFGKRVLYSQPYYFAEYQMVVAAGAPEPKPDASLAVERGVAVLGVRDRTVIPYPDLETILADVAASKIPAGYVIAPRAHWLAHDRWPKQLMFRESYDRVPICAALRKSDDALQSAVNEAFANLAKSGRLAEVFARWHIPYNAPVSLTPSPLPRGERGKG